MLHENAWPASFLLSCFSMEPDVNKLIDNSCGSGKEDMLFARPQFRDQAKTV